jgi:hypothetical protein
VQRCWARNCRRDYGLRASRREIRMRRRKARKRRREFCNRDNRYGEDWFIEWQMERRGSVHGELGVAVPPRNIAERELRDIDACVQRRLGLFLRRRGLLVTLGRETRFVFGGQDFRTAQIVFGVHVLLLLRLLFAGAFLACSFRGILRLLGATMCCSEKQAGAKKDGEPAPKRLAERHPRVHVLLTGTGEVSFCHCRPTVGGHPMAEYYWKPGLVATAFF